MPVGALVPLPPHAANPKSSSVAARLRRSDALPRRVRDADAQKAASSKSAKIEKMTARAFNFAAPKSDDGDSRAGGDHRADSPTGSAPLEYGAV